MTRTALDVTPEAAVSDYLVSFENADAMAALHGRSSHVEERLGVLSRYGHTPATAFASVYDNLRLDEWFPAAGVKTATRSSVVTWRGAVAPVPISDDR